jgi:hypothetical protein
MDILKYGADVEVLGPPKLRELIEREIERMAARVGGNAEREAQAA